MRRLPVDDSGAALVPPAVKPQLNRKLTGGREVLLVTQARHYALITPLLGGGVEPGEADPVTTIRGSEIRGHLRFWWRACRGGCFNGDLAEMKKAEDELWGAASTEKNPRPAQVEVAVKVTNQGREEKPFERRAKPSPEWKDLAYAAFPLQDKSPPGKVREGVAFTVTLTFPQKKQAEVEAALWAWETFGGIGARTRRGFGALKLVGVDDRPVTPPRADEVEAVIREGLLKHVVSGSWPEDVPYLPSGRPLNLKITEAHSDPRAAWGYLIRRLKDFRQRRHPGTSPGRPGRSKWPEPDEIRRLLDRRCAKHAKPLSSVRKFPRAAFGLPIVVHFKDAGAGDPDDTMLRGQDCKRLASPLILRPLACTGGTAGLALVLEGTGVFKLPGGLVLSQVKGPGKSWPVEAAVDRDEAQQISPLQGNPDVLQAFFKTL